MFWRLMGPLPPLTSELMTWKEMTSQRSSGSVCILQSYFAVSVPCAVAWHQFYLHCLVKPTCINLPVNNDTYEFGSTYQTINITRSVSWNSNVSPSLDFAWGAFSPPELSKRPQIMCFKISLVFVIQVQCSVNMLDFTSVFPSHCVPANNLKATSWSSAKPESAYWFHS